MKRSKEDAAETRRHIVATAAREFRDKGLQLGVADLMSSAGLTHGGFYRHFESKDELIGEACAEGMRALIDSFEESASRTKPRDAALKKLINRYMSTAHRDESASGCPVAALGTELARSSDTVRARVSHEASRLVKLIASLLDAKQFDDVESEALCIMTCMLGAVIMARIIPDTRTSSALLRRTADTLIDKYC